MGEGVAADDGLVGLDVEAVMVASRREARRIFCVLMLVV